MTYPTEHIMDALKVAERMITMTGKVITHDRLAFPVCLRSVRKQTRQLRWARKIIRNYMKCGGDFQDVLDACGVAKQPDIADDPDNAAWMTWRCLNSVYNMLDISIW